jgi:hypothetical protein
VHYRPSEHGHLLVTGADPSASDAFLQRLTADAASVMDVRVLGPWDEEDVANLELERTVGNLVYEIRGLAEAATGAARDPHTLLIVDTRCWDLLGTSSGHSNGDPAHLARLAAYLEQIVRAARQAGFIIVAAAREDAGSGLSTVTGYLKACASFLSINAASTDAVFSEYGVFPLHAALPSGVTAARNGPHAGELHSEGSARTEDLLPV